MMPAGSLGQRRKQSPKEDNPSKRLKSSHEEQASDESPTLVEDVFSVVLSLLAPREMLRLACCSKNLMNMVTHEQIMRSAIMSRGHAKTSMKYIVSLLAKGKIFVPTPMRLLRLANGQRCELPGCKNVVHNVRPHVGLFVCWPCFSKSSATTRVLMTSYGWLRNENFRKLVEHPRTAHYIYQRKCHLWASPFMSSEGEYAGPLITAQDIEGLLEKQQTIESHLALIDPNRKQGLVDSLVKVVEEASERSVRNQEEDRKIKKARLGKYRKEKAENFLSVVSSIEYFLDPRWKHFALRLWWYSQDGWEKHREYPDHDYDPRFESGMVRKLDLLASFVKAPARATQKKVVKIALSVDNIFAPIFDSGLHDFSFLSSDKNSQPFEAYLKEHLVAHHKMEDFVLSLTEDDVSRLQKYGPLMALACKLSGEEHRILRPPICFAASVLSCFVIDNPLSTDETFVKRLWSLKSSDSDWFPLKQMCDRTFYATRTVFLPVRQSILEYIYDPQTVAFKHSGDDRNPEWLRVKREEIEKVWVDKDLISQFMEGVADFHRIRQDQASRAEARWLGGQW